MTPLPKPPLGPWRVLEDCMCAMCVEHRKPAPDPLARKRPEPMGFISLSEFDDNEPDKAGRQ